MSFLRFCVLLNCVIEALGIFGGELAKNGEFPHQVQVLIDGIYTCGGSIISPNIVLTAAHCLENESRPEGREVDLVERVIVIAGQNKLTDLRKPNLERSVQVRMLADYFLYPKYDTEVDNDIGILLLRNPFQWTERVAPIKVIQPHQQVYTVVTVAGWGRPGNYETDEAKVSLKKVTETFISSEDCANFYFIQYGGYSKDLLLNGLYCGKTQLGQGTCEGDSGSGVVCSVAPTNGWVYLDDSQATKVLCAVTVRGENVECGRHFLNHFLDLSPHLKWIEETIKTPKFGRENVRESLPMKCDANHFFCPSNRSCTERAKLCDGRRDCALGEDEANCFPRGKSCTDEEFRCSNGRCVGKEKRCNGRNDCQDSEYSPSDEDKCFGVEGDKNCSKGAHDCGKGDRCIPERWKCDGIKDCGNGSDEEMCTVWERILKQTFWQWVSFIGYICMAIFNIDTLWQVCCSGFKEARICHRLATLDWF